MHQSRTHFNSRTYLAKEGFLSLALPLLVLTFIFLNGCSPKFTVPKDHLTHMLALTRTGGSFDLLPPKDVPKNERLPWSGLEGHVKAIVENIKREQRNNKNPNGESEKKRILIYVHGGLNGIKDSVRSSEELVQLMSKERQRKDGILYYPIIINWESSLTQAYFDHLYRIRQGKESLAFGIVTSPLYLIWDLGRGILRYPFTLTYQIYKGIVSVPEHSEDAVARYNQDFYSSKQKNNWILLGQDKADTASLHWFGDTMTYFFPGILKLITTPLLDAFGKPAWDNMVRRTQTVMRTPQEFILDVDEKERVKTNATSNPLPKSLPLTPEESLPTGGLSILMEQLKELNTEDYRYTLIGHSMGTIILNEMIRIYGNDFKFDEIVYLAAACTIGDFEATIIPYMEKNPEAHFYNLTLHPRADARERYMLDALPRGSLLEWIDDFARNPASFMELTMGKWNNAIMAWHIIPPTKEHNLRNRVTLKGFGIEDPIFNNRPPLGQEGEPIIFKPQKHKELNDAQQRFWKPDYWGKPKKAKRTD